MQGGTRMSHLVRLAIVVVALLTIGNLEAAVSDLRLRVDLSDRTLEAMIGDEVIEAYPVSVGKSGHSTPTGQYRIAKVIWNPGWVPPPSRWARGKSAKRPGDPGNPMKRVKMFFREPTYYIHGTGEVDSLGSAASHGCIRMAPDDAEHLGKIVMEYGGQVKPEPWYRRLFKSRRSQVVFLSNPIVLEIEA